MARRKKETSDEMIERFQKQQDAQEAPERGETTEEVMLVKKTFLYGSVALAGSLVTVPATIANVLRAKGIVK